jgi:hypothetical protein
MPERKACIQDKYPELQTPCYKAIGEPCGEDKCNVLGVVKLLYQMTGEKVTKGEIVPLLHTHCNQSNAGPDENGFSHRLSIAVQEKNSF